MQQPHAHLARPVHKEPPAHAPNAALLIDFDNVTMGIRSDLQSELRRLLQSEIIRGKVAVQRAYADWRRYPQYIVPLSESSIDLIFAPAYGSNKKNATDIRLAIDALELVFIRPEIGTFILLSGDSDFSSLVLKLKEYGKYVIGVGIRESSSDLLIQNCDEYYSYNELAGFQKQSDVVHERWDVWQLVVEAVKQMTAHNDVMRSDRLKQVMQEIDPAFDEKDAGYSRFTKFVQEAARKGLIGLTRRDNGQFEIALGGNASAPAAQPGTFPEAEPEAPPAREPRRGSLVGDAFGLLKQALGQSRDEETTEPARDPAEPAAEPEVPRAATAAVSHDSHDLEDEPPMPQSSAPPPPYSTSGAGATPLARSARFRRGSKGGPRPAPSAPRVGVVETDAGHRPAAPAAPRGAEVGEPAAGGSGERRERGDRPRGGRGRGGRGTPRSGEPAEASGERPERGERTERPERGERGERGGRSRRGGRGRGRGGEERRDRYAGEPVRMESAGLAPASPPPPPPPPAPKRAPEPDASGDSFWTRVKRGLTGGGNA
jgi:uncharacterized protein (TIGR00288 family)